jgi:L-Ala-D/L-Glu epimerase
MPRTCDSGAAKRRIKRVRITGVRTFPIHLTVRPEFYIVSSAGAHAVSRYVLVAIDTDAGVTGWGEASVVPIWSGETQGGALALIHDYVIPLLLGRDPCDVETLAREIDALAIDNPFTKAAVEMALLDVAGQAAGKPVYELLGGPANALKIPIKFSIGLREPDDAANIAAGKVKEGFTAIKLKVGPDPEKDLARVRDVRAAIGPDVKLNVDVNGGWSVEQSIREIPRYAPYRLEYVEQPTPRWDIDALARVREAADVQIMADEAVFSIHHAEQVIAKRAADLISIYPGKNGGILAAKRICELAADAGIACHLGSNLEWHVGTAAMCHLTAACANVTISKFPVDILGPLYYAVKPRSKPIHFERGHVHVPAGNGLGVDISPDELNALSPQPSNRK